MVLRGVRSGVPRAEKMKLLLLGSGCLGVEVERLASTVLRFMFPNTLLFGRGERAETLGKNNTSIIRTQLDVVATDLIP